MVKKIKLIVDRFVYLDTKEFQEEKLKAKQKGEIVLRVTAIKFEK